MPPLKVKVTFLGAPALPTARRRWGGEAGAINPSLSLSRGACLRGRGEEAPVAVNHLSPPAGRLPFITVLYGADTD